MIGSTFQEGNISQERSTLKSHTRQASEAESPIVHQEGHTSVADDFNEYSCPWNAIKPDIDVLNDMIFQYGALDVIVEDVEVSYKLTSYNSDTTYGVILAFPLNEFPSPGNTENPLKGAERINFSRQVVLNSSATLSLVNILANVEIEKDGQLVHIGGKVVKEFTELTKDLNSIDRGLAVGNSKEFKEIHTSYESMEHQVTDAQDDDKENTKPEIAQEPREKETYHYVSYISKEGYLWELDSFNLHPTRLKEIGQGEKWLEVLEPILDQKITSGDLQYRLFALCENSISKKEAYLMAQNVYQDNLMKERDVKILNIDDCDTSGYVSESDPAQIIDNLEDEMDFTRMQTDLVDARLADLMQSEADRVSRLENDRLLPLHIITGMAVQAVERKMDFERFQHISETEGRNTHPDPQSNRRITRSVTAKAQKGKQTAIDVVPRGRGRGRGSRGRGNRGRGRSSLGRGQGRGKTSKDDTSSTEKKGTSTKKRARDDDDDEEEAARKAKVLERYYLRK